MRLIQGQAQGQGSGKIRRRRRDAVVVAAMAVAALAGIGAGVTAFGAGSPSAEAEGGPTGDPAPTTTTTGVAPATTTTAPVPVDPPPGRALPVAEEAALVTAIPQGRPSIDAERLLCLGPGPSGMGTPPGLPGDQWAWGWTDHPLAEALDVDAMVASCVETWSPAADPPTGAEPGARADRCARTGAVPWPVIAVGGLTCADGAAEGIELRPLTDADLVVLDHLRAVEIAMLALPEPCRTVEQTRARVELVLAEEGLDLHVHVDDGPVHDHGDPEGAVEPPPECPWFSRVDWDAGQVVVEPFHS